MLHVIIGGARSGKSRYAASLAGSAPTTYVATAQRSEDAEFMRRIERHRADRPPAWVTVEEPYVPAAAVARARTACVIVDCLTLWLTNVLMARPNAGDGAIADEIDASLDRLAQAARERDVLVVTNEVGNGIVPIDPLARRFVDLQGRANQRIAELAARVTLMVAGVAVRVKG